MNSIKKISAKNSLYRYIDVWSNTSTYITPYLYLSIKSPFYQIKTLESLGSGV